MTDFSEPSKTSIGYYFQKLTGGVLYFAYDSNLCLHQMKFRCPKSIKIGQGILKNYKWIINKRGYANIVKSPSDYVMGSVFRISLSDENKLDKFEGVKNGNYEKKTLKVSLENQDQSCLVYVDPIISEGPIKSEYTPKINCGIVDSNISQQYADEYIRKFMPDLSFNAFTEHILKNTRCNDEESKK